jgi:hypothetical protein
VRSLFALDVLLAGYAGFMVGPVILLTRWLAAAFGGWSGLVSLYSSQDYVVFFLGVICTLWCVVHWILPIPALVVAIGIRLGRPWARLVGRGLGLVLLMLPPVGSLIGALVMYRLSLPEGVTVERA